MRNRLLLAIFLIATAISTNPVEATSFFEHVRFTRSGQSNLRRLTSSASYSQTPVPQCLYYNAKGVCMVEQYIDPYNYRGNRLLYAPTYSRNYQSRERRYSNRDDENADDDDRYDYRSFEDDDDRYTAIEDDDFSDDDDFQDNHEDDDPDFDDFFEDDDDGDDDSSDDDDDDDDDDDGDDEGDDEDDDDE